MPRALPQRTRGGNEISAAFNDGVVRILALEALPADGDLPRGELREKLKLPYQERKLGIRRSYNVAICPVTEGLKRNEMVFGLGYRYLATIGDNPEGVIGYSDHYQFLEDRRVYIIKAYGNGFPMDGHAFVLCDISGLQGIRYEVEISEPVGTNDASLSSLSLGAAVLSPAFAPATKVYTATTNNAANVIRAVPADVQATVQILINDEEIPNGTAATWDEGENEVTILVTASDGETENEYAITVTKS